jgi:hypothetical protein
MKNCSREYDSPKHTVSLLPHDDSLVFQFSACGGGKTSEALMVTDAHGLVK